MHPTLHAPLDVLQQQEVRWGDLKQFFIDCPETGAPTIINGPQVEIMAVPRDVARVWGVTLSFELLNNDEMYAADPTTSLTGCITIVQGTGSSFMRRKVAPQISVQASPTFDSVFAVVDYQVPAHTLRIEAFLQVSYAGVKAFTARAEINAQVAPITRLREDS
jgi:hypothetical protein